MPFFIFNYRQLRIPLSLTFSRRKTVIDGCNILADLSEIILPLRTNNILDITKGLIYFIRRLDKYTLQTERLTKNWEYVAVLDNRTRPEHAQLNGMIFRYDDPFWASFYPPNGWRCRCRVNALSPKNLKSKGYEASSSNGLLSTEMRLVSKKTGELKPVTVYTDSLTGKKIAPDVGWSHPPSDYKQAS